MAKKLSLIAKGVAIVFAIVAFTLFDKSATDIMIVCGFIAGAFLPVDISLIKQAGSKGE